jgi:hypothetical protein
MNLYYSKLRKKIKLHNRDPFAFIIVSVIISIVISFIPEEILDKGQSITIGLSILGIGFTYSQSIQLEKNIEKRRAYDIKYAAYWEIVQYVESTLEIVHNEVYAGDINNSLKQFISMIINRRNILNTKVTLYNDLIFKEILYSKEYDDFIIEIDKILDISMTFTETKFKASESHFDWGSKILDQMDVIYDSKSRFYEKLQLFLS